MTSVFHQPIANNSHIDENNPICLETKIVALRILDPAHKDAVITQELALSTEEVL